MAENNGQLSAENEPTPESVNEGVQTGSPIATEDVATGPEQREGSANISTEERPHEQAQSDNESDESPSLSDDSTAKESLRTAIEKGNLDEVKGMVGREGAMDIDLAYDLPDFMASKLVTPLMLAVICGQTSIVGLLLELGADVNANIAGWRALDFSFLNDQPAIAETLLKNGADLGVRNMFIERTALHCAAEKGFLGCVKLLLKQGADPNTANFVHVTPLHLAIAKGHFMVVGILLESRANIEAVDNDEWNCLHYGCRANQTEIVKLLLEKGANKSHILNGIDNHGCTPLQIAGHSDVDIVELLLQQPGIEVAIRDADGDTPLSQAAWDENHEVILRLLTSDKYFPKDPVQSQACLSTSFEAERILPVLKGIIENDLCETEVQFEAILFWAVSNGHVEFLRESCLSGRELKPLTRKVGDTTWLHIAAKYGQEEMIKYLLREGFELETVAVDGITAFHLVAESGNLKAAEILCMEIYKKHSHDSMLRVTQLIIQKDHQGRSPLSLCVRGHHKATERLFWDMLRLFVKEHGSHEHHIFETHPSEANQLLELAAELDKPGDEKFLATLFDAWFDSPKEDLKGWTVLHLAVYHRQVVPVWWLLSNGSHLGSKEMQRAKEISSNRRKSEEDDANRNKKKNEENEENKELRLLIAEMLHNPPPIASHMDQDDEGFPNPPRISDDVLRPNALEGAIIDVHRKDGQEKLDLQFKQEDLSKIIYDWGPGEIMSTARNKNWRDLHSLKENINERLNKNVKKSGLGTHLASDRDSQRQPSILTEVSRPGDGSAKKHPKKTTEEEKSAKHPDSLAYRWIHIPTNDDLVTRVSIDAGKKNKHLRPLTKFLDESWIELAAGNQKRYMRPMCTHQPTGPSQSRTEKGEAKARHKNTETDTSHRKREDRKEDSSAVENMISTLKRKQIKDQGAIALYMPYLTLGELGEDDTKNIPMEVSRYDEYAIFKEIMKGLEPGTGSYKYDGLLKSRESGAGSTSIEKGPHEEMTLDQFYYSTLSETETRSRDKDQVLSRYLSPADESQTSERSKTILVVHQLWLFVIDERTIISATTQPSLQSGDVIIEGVWEHLVSRRTDGDIDSVIELILSVATGLFTKEVVNVNATEGGTVMKGALDVFRESIRHVAHQEAERFQRFTDYLDEGKKGEQEEKKPSEEDKTENPFRDVSPETKLLREIKDICDELNILKALAEAQVDVWKEALQVDDLKDFKSKYNRLCKPTAVKRAIESMIQDAHIARDSLGVLLDLIHKQASINEAESGQKQAMDAAKQSSTTMVFTLVTAVFLPLSFFTSFFAMNVTEFPHNGDNVQYEGKWIFPIIFLGSLGVTIISILVAFNFDYLGKLGNLPKDLKRWLRMAPDIQDLTPDMQRLTPEMRYARKMVEELRQFRNKPNDEENGGDISSSGELHPDKGSHD